MTGPAADDAAIPVARSISPRQVGVLKTALLIALASLPFLPTLRGPFFWDDAQNIEFNRSLRTTTGLKAIWVDPLASFQYYPITYSVFWLEFQLFGEKPFGYHVVNLMLHAANALLVWRTLASIRAPAPWWIAALFAVHPIQVETVGWISEQKNLLSTGFALLALRFWEASSAGVSTLNKTQAVAGSRRWFIVATITFAVALMAKSVALVLPFWTAVYELISRRRRIGNWLPRLSIWIVVGLAAGFMTSWRESAASTSMSAAGTPPNLKVDERVLLVCKNLSRYAGVLCCLEPLVPIPSRSFPSWNDSSAIASMLGVFAALWFGFVECRRGRPWMLLGLTFFAFQLGPTLGLVRFQFQCHSFVADHFCYFACLGFFIALVATVRLQPSIARGLGSIVLALLTVMTWNQSRAFADPERIWRANVEANPASWGARVNLADVLLKAGFTEAALDAAANGVALEPTAAMGYGILGTASAQLGKQRDAERAFREALRLRPQNPQFHHNLANVLAREKRFHEAIDEYRLAAERAPDFAMTHYLMGDAYRSLGMIPEAKVAMRRVMQIDPGFQPAKAALEALERPTKNQLK